MARKKKDPLLDGLALFAALAVEQGVSLDLETIAEDNNITGYGEKEARALKIDEADAVLKSLHHPHSLMVKPCRRCGEIFSTNYCSVGYCSVTCRKKGLSEEFGIEWNFSSEPTFGKYEPPKTVSPEALKALYKWATHLVKDYDELVSLQEMKSQEHRRLQAEKAAQELAAEIESAEPLFAEPGPEPVSRPEPEEERPVQEAPSARIPEQESEDEFGFDF